MAGDYNQQMIGLLIGLVYFSIGCVIAYAFSYFSWKADGNVQNAATFGGLLIAITPFVAWYLTTSKENLNSQSGAVAFLIIPAVFLNWLGKIVIAAMLASAELKARNKGSLQ